MLNYFNEICAKKVFLLFSLYICFITNTFAQVTCADLDGSFVLAQDGEYLGFFGNSFASESINNEFGSYGSSFSSSSVRNSFGQYGSQFGVFSANNPFSASPPIIFRLDSGIAYLSTNTTFQESISLNEIDESCQFFSSEPLFPLPGGLSGLNASDGEFTDVVLLTWDTALYTTEYEIYYSSSPDGTRTYITTTEETSITITGGTPGEVYYYFVFPANLAGVGQGQYDSGYIAGQTLPDDLSGLNASDGTHNDFVRVNWSPSDSATGYEVYFSSTIDGERTFIAETTNTSIDITGGAPGKTYYYFVFPKNSSGLGLGQWDSGSVKLILSFNDQSLNKVTGLNLSDKKGASNFAFGMHLQKSSTFINQASTNEAITVKGYIYPKNSDIGSQADIFIVVVSPNGLFHKSLNGTFVPWSGKIKELTPAIENLNMNSTVQIDIYSGEQAAKGSYKYFIGYMRPDVGDLIVSSAPGKFSSYKDSESFLWTVTSGSNEVTIAGSVHVLEPSDYPINQDYIDAYEEADILVTEVLLDDFQNSSSLANLYKSDDGSLLSETLSSEIYNALKLYLADAGENISNYEEIHPNWMSIFILNIELDKLGYTDGIDLYFMEQAAEEGKFALGLESLASQILVLKQLNSHLTADDVIFQALITAEYGLVPLSVNELISNWTMGDENALEILLDAERANSEKDYNLILVNRNVSWIPQIENFLSTPETEFIIVGVNHLIGPDSVIELLKAKGYEIFVH